MELTSTAPIFVVLLFFIDTVSASSFAEHEVVLERKETSSKLLSIPHPYIGSNLYDDPISSQNLGGASWTAFGNPLYGGEATRGDNVTTTTLSSGSDVVVSANGKTLVVGMYDAGIVRIFRNSSSELNQIGELVAPWENDDKYGSRRSTSISRNGNIIALGSPYTNTNANRVGRTRVFKYDGSTWTQRGQTLDGWYESQYFGIETSMSLDGNILAVGGYGVDGSACVYEYSSGSWVQLGSTLSGGTGEGFGRSVSLSDDGNTLAVGAGNGDGGYLRVFDFDGTSWNQRGDDIVGLATGDRFGTTTSLSGDGNTVAGGSIFYDRNYTNEGYAKAFSYSSGAWSPVGGTIYGGFKEARLGQSLSLSTDGSMLAVGSEYYSNNTGRVWVYKNVNNIWKSMGDTTADSDGGIPAISAGEKFGSALEVFKIDDLILLIVGAPAYNNQEGRVDIYIMGNINPPTSMPSITLPDLQEWYLLNAANATIKPISAETVQISLPFNASNRDHGAEIFTKDCTTPFDSNMYFEVSTTKPMSDNPDGFMQFNVIVDMNISALSSTDYWTYLIDKRGGGYVEICVETYLMSKAYTLADEPEKVTFVNNLLNISVSQEVNFLIDTNGVEFKREKVANEDLRTDYSDLITAYVCNASDPINLPIELTSATTYNQGDELTICVTDTGEGYVQVERFDALVVSQAGTQDYNYINDTIYNHDITSITCQDGPSATAGRVCHAKIILLGRFFSEENPPDINVEGSVELMFNGARRERRNLRLSLPSSSDKNEVEIGMSSPHAEEDGKGSFNMQVSLSSSSYSIAFSNYLSAVGHPVSMAVGATVAAVMVFLLAAYLQIIVRRKKTSEKYALVSNT